MRNGWTRQWRSPKRLASLLGPYPSEAMAAYPVGSRVNNPGNDDPGCIEPAAEKQRHGGGTHFVGRKWTVPTRVAGASDTCRGIVGAAASGPSAESVEANGRLAGSPHPNPLANDEGVHPMRLILTDRSERDRRNFYPLTLCRPLWDLPAA